MWTDASLTGWAACTFVRLAASREVVSRPKVPSYQSTGVAGGAASHIEIGPKSFNSGAVRQRKYNCGSKPHRLRVTRNPSHCAVSSDLRSESRLVFPSHSGGDKHSGGSPLKRQLSRLRAGIIARELPGLGRSSGTSGSGLGCHSVRSQNQEARFSLCSSRHLSSGWLKT